jgi:hypothetical protein
MKPKMCDKERFLKDTANHQMRIIRDDGVNRHIRYGELGSSVYQFDLITWAGHLCITGDCGTYVFSRVNDMFNFFRGDRINPGYWEEKCLAYDRHGKTEKYSSDLFQHNVVRYFWESTSEMDRAERRELWAAIKEDVISYADDGEARGLQAAMEFEHNGFLFTDFWEYDCNEYSFHFLWILYAIVYGINQYDQHLHSQQVKANWWHQILGRFRDQTKARSI